MGANYFRLTTINMFKPSIKMGFNYIIFYRIYILGVYQLLLKKDYL